MPVELTDEQRRQVLESRLTQFAFDKFGHTLNRQVAVEQGDSDAVAVADGAIAVIDAAALVYEAELASIPMPPAPIGDPELPDTDAESGPDMTVEVPNAD